MDRLTGAVSALALGLFLTILPVAVAAGQATGNQVASPGRYFGELPGTILRDLVTLPSDALSPAGRPLLGLGVAFILSGPLYLDEAVRDMARPLKGGVRVVPARLKDYLIDPFNLDNTDLVIGLHAGSLAVLGAGWITGNDEVADWGAALLETVLLVDVIILPTKVLTGRKRPGRGDGALDFSPLGSVHDAFPSGHAAWSLGIASLVSRSPAQRWVKVLCWVTGAAVSLQRVLSDTHWTSDVVIGGMLGIWVGKKVAERHWGAKTGTP